MNRPLAILTVTLAVLACGQETSLPLTLFTDTVTPAVSRLESLPADAHKMAPSEERKWSHNLPVSQT